MIRRPLALFVLVLTSLAFATAQAEPWKPEGAKKVRIAGVGDSIPQGVGAQAGNSYPSQLQELLGDRFEVGNQAARERKASVIDMHAALLPKPEFFPDRVMGREPVRVK